MEIKYLSTGEIAQLWGISERGVRNYCSEGRVNGAVLIGKNWKIPETAEKPSRISSRSLLHALSEEKSSRVKGGIYHKLQIELTYNSNHIEGSKLTHDQTRYIFETNTIGVVNESINVDDLIETVNHFGCIDMVIDSVNSKLSEKFIKELHGKLKSGTADSRKDWFNVGEYKKLPNEVGGCDTTSPEMVHEELEKLLASYNDKKNVTFEDIVEFHVEFERIHPFQDGNGRVGRLIALKECLKFGITPFIIDDELKLFYYRGLKEWSDERGYLLETCAAAQDKFDGYLKHFGISKIR